MPGAEAPAPISGEAAGKAAPAVPTDEGALKKPPPSAERQTGEAGAKKPPVAPVPATPKVKAEAPADTGRFEIQAAAYREKKQAEQLAKKLTDLGFSSHVVTKDLPGKGRWYRVIAGGFESREKAAGGRRTDGRENPWPELRDSCH